MGQILDRLMAQEPQQEATEQPVVAPAAAGGEVVLPDEVTVDVEIDGDDEAGVMTQITDGIAGIPRGIVSFVENAGDNVGQIVEDTVGLPGGGIAFDSKHMDPDDELFTWLSLDEQRARRAKDPIFGLPFEDDNVTGQPSTLTGNVTRSLSQFATGFMTFRGLLGGSGLASTLGASTATDAMGFKVQSARLSNMVQENEWLRNPLSEYLQHKDEDGFYESQLKQALEGAALGVPLEVAMRIFKGFRDVKGLSEDKASQHFESVVEPEVQQLMKDKGLDPTQAELEFQRMMVESRANRHLRRVEDGGKPSINMDRLQETLSQRRAGDDVIADNNVFNWRKMDSRAEADQVWTQLTNEMKGNVGRWSKEGTYTMTEMQTDAAHKLADLIGGDPMDYYRGLQQTAMGADDQIAYLLSGKMMAQSLALEVDKLAKAAEMGDDVMGELIARVEQLADVSQQLKDIQRSAARVTAAGRVKTADLGNAELVAKMLEEKGGSEAARLLSYRIRALAGDPKGITQMAERIAKGETLLGRGVRVINEYYINSLLSGPTTHFVNATSNAVKMVANPVEKILGGAVTRNLDMADEGARQVVHLFTSVPQALNYAWKAFKQADNVLDPNVRITEDIGPAIQKGGDSPLAHAINFLGAITRMPSRALLTSDEVFKQMTYRSSLKARLDQQSFGVVPGNTKEARAARKQWVEARFKAGFDENGKGIDGVALSEAQEATFTTPLDAADRSRATQAMSKFQRFANDVPIVRQMVPFIRTPWNLITDVAVRTPGIAHLSSQFRAKLNSPDPRVVAKTKGQLASGSLLWSGAATMAMEGKITGEGPTDPKVRERWMATGWRPYSIVMTKDDGSYEYVSYRRGDPYGTFLGLVANWHEIAANLTPEENEEVLAVGLMTMKTLSSKTFLQGLYNVMGGLQGDHKTSAAVRNYLAGYAPNLLMQSANVADDTLGTNLGDTTKRFKNDPVMKLLDGFKAKIPGWSEDLPARYDFVTGKTLEYDRGDTEWFGSVSPFVRAQEEFDPVLKELRNLNIGMSNPPRMVGDYEFSKAEYEQYLRFIHRPTKDVPTLHDSILKLIESEDYNAIPSNMSEIGVRGVPSRQKMVRTLVQKYRRAAEEQMQKKFPYTYGDYMKTTYKGVIDALKADSEGVAQRIVESLKQPLK